MATANATGKMTKSKTDQALDYMAEHNVSAYAAAKAVGVAVPAVYKRLKVLEATASQRCPCCHQLIKASA